MPGIERVTQFFLLEDREYERRGGKPFNGLSESIRFQNVSFRYSERDRLAVNEVDLEIKKGSMTALVGASGAGKSTIVDLLLGIYDPTDGVIQVDSVNLADLSLMDWRSQIGVVSQNVAMLNLSVADNIAFGKTDSTREDIEEAAKEAHAHEFITEFSNGYDTLIGDSGHRLSGGQRQRIALARALIRKPQILILDEATSALDSVSERMIQKVIEEMHGELTIVAVAHRLSTVVSSDHIVVLQDGSVVEEGTHEELAKLGKVYAGYWNLQSNGSNG